MPEPLLTRYMQPLLAGRRAECFDLISGAIGDGHDAEAIACEVVWPAMTQIRRLFCDDRIDLATHDMACRVSRAVVHQLQPYLPRRASNGKRILITSPDEPRAAIGAEILADLCQSDGWDVYLIGAVVPHDELLKLVGELRPHVLWVYGTQPQEVPNVRRFIELVREIGVCPTMNIVASGGVFDRVDGLWQEVGADILVDWRREAARVVAELPPREPGPRRLGIVKKRRRRRKVAV